jgi:hypothetical protein
MNKREAGATQSVRGSAANHRPSEEEIAIRAYEIFISRCATPGNDLDDWLQAERELVEENRDSARLRSRAAS